MYETRPDASLSQGTTQQVIANDDAAQLLCAVFNAMPWLAVKRLSLFQSKNHALIFNESVTASHVVLVDLIRKRVDEESHRFPERYRRSWRLTRLVAVYLVGQILRSDGALKTILDDRKAAYRIAPAWSLDWNYQYELPQEHSSSATISMIGTTRRMSSMFGSWSRRRRSRP